MTKLRVAVVQAAPVPLAIDAGIIAAVEHARSAIEAGARLVAFGETFLGGYPLWLDEAADAALWDHAGVKALHAILLDQAVTDADARLAPLQALCDEHGTVISIGTHFRRRSSLYNNQMTLRPHAQPLHHFKLVPTHGERLIWARGDGSTLTTHDSEAGPIGSLICWEHWMPLARAVMHNSGEVVHIAAWPTVRETYAIASRHYAFEGRCFVLAAGTVQHRDDLLEGLARTGNDSDARALVLSMPDAQLQFGGSMIINPAAAVVAQAGSEPSVLIADCDPALRNRELAALDTDGHYSRPDIFELRVDRRPRDGVVDIH